MTETFEELCRRYEHFETPRWAVDAILRHEILTRMVVDPCVGTGVLADVAKAWGHETVALDIHDWGYPLDRQCDFLALDDPWYLPASCDDSFSVLMNPPFSKAESFVEKSFELRARKVVMFQRFAFWESQTRRPFWTKFPPNRIYICGDRADCWRHDLPKDAKGRRFHPTTSRQLAGSPTAHAWFAWERGHPPGTLVSHIWKAAAGGDAA